MPATELDLIETGMSLWEHCLEKRPRSFELHLGLWGAAETRSRIASFAKHCHDAWEHAYNTLDYQDSFDWEWCPAWFDVCVDEDLDLVTMNVTTQADLVVAHG